MAHQNNWRGCNKCSAVFFNGFQGNPNNRCTVGGSHVAQSFNFQLPFNVGETGTAQANWRGCNKCSVLFFDGFPGNPNTTCAGGGRHQQQSESFVLPHDIPGSPNEQPGWRGCNKCSALFFDGFQDNPNNRCPAGGSHVPQGFSFVLPHFITPSVSLNSQLDAAGREHLTATGRGFSPLSDVGLVHTFFRPSSTLTQGPEKPARTDNEGGFSEEVMTGGVPGNAFRISIRATDTPTGTAATSNVLRPTVP